MKTKYKNERLKSSDNLLNLMTNEVQTTNFSNFFLYFILSHQSRILIFQKYDARCTLKLGRSSFFIRNKRSHWEGASRNFLRFIAKYSKIHDNLLLLSAIKSSLSAITQVNSRVEKSSKILTKLMKRKSCTIH